MNKKKLFDLLTLLGGVMSIKWEMVCFLVDSINLQAIIVSGKWNDDWKQSKPEYYPLQLKKINTWSTHDDTCIDLHFYTKEHQLHCTAKIYDGDSFNGDRKNLRFTAVIILPISFIDNLEPSIISKLNRYMDNAYEDYLETQKALWIQNMRHNLLK